MKGYAGITPTVEAIGKLGLTGNIVPRPWYQWLKFDNGKPNAVAIAILSELCYWYRPLEEVDEKTGRITGWRRRFKADLLQKSYQDLADCLGFTKRQISDNAHWLESKGLVKIERRHFSFASNVVFFDLIPEEIERISFSIPDKSDVTLEREMGYVETEDGLTVERDTYTEITYRELNKNKAHAHAALRRPPSSFGCDRALFFDQADEENYQCQDGKQRFFDSGTDGETAVVNNPLVEAEVVTLPTPPSSAAPPSPQEKFSSVRVDKKSKPAKIKFTVNHLGWLQLPKNKQHSFARWLAVRRLKYQLALSFSNVNIANDRKGNTRTQGNEIGFMWGDKIWFENEMLDGEREGNPFDLTKLRDTLDDRCMVTQEVFNDFLEYAFMDSLKWLDENGMTGRREFKYNSPAFTFLNKDNQVFAGMKEKHESS